MRGLVPVIQAFVPVVIDAGAASTEGDIINAQFVGHTDARNTPPTHRFLQKTRCSAGIQVALHEDFQGITLGVYGTAEPVFLSRYADDPLIEVAFVRSRRSTPTDCRDDLSSEVAAPRANYLVADRDPTFGQQILNVAKAECTSVLRPYRIRDDRT
jgi:hypothetical protein